MCTVSCDPVKNRPEDDYLLVETCSLHITLCNKNSCADVQISITIRIQALRDVFTQILYVLLLPCEPQAVTKENLHFSAQYLYD